MLSLLYEQALHLARPLGPWLANYLIHSTVLAGLAWLAATRLRSPAVREMVWRCALFGPLLTTSAQALLGESLPGKRIAVGSAAEPAAGEAGAGAVALAVPTGSPAAPAARRSTPAPGRAQAADGAAPLEQQQPHALTGLIDTLAAPFRLLYSLTIPNCAPGAGGEHWFIVTFLSSFAWIAAISAGVVFLAGRLACDFGISHALMGVTVGVPGL